MYRELLGFDIRLCPEDFLESIWSDDVRNALLLRTDVNCPLTVDNALWPTFFRYIEEPIIAASPIGETIYIEAQDYRQEKLWLWQSLADMVQFFNNDILSKRGISIAVCLYSETNPMNYGYWDYALYPGLKGYNIPQDWKFLGYDIADASRGRKSGLVNCGYTEQEKLVLKPYWVPRINELGLFSNLDDAFEFRDITNKRVPSHAPFYVYGLYRDPHIITN